MKKVDFDNYADNYDEIMNNQLSSFEKDVSYFAEYKIVETKKYLKTLPNKILDFGCGVGRNINFIEKHFDNAKLFGCDISSKSIPFKTSLGSIYATKDWPFIKGICSIIWVYFFIAP